MFLCQFIRTAGESVISLQHRRFPGGHTHYRAVPRRAHDDGPRARRGGRLCFGDQAARDRTSFFGSRERNGPSSRIPKGTGIAASEGEKITLDVAVSGGPTKQRPQDGFSTPRSTSTHSGHILGGGREIPHFRSSGSGNVLDGYGDASVLPRGGLGSLGQQHRHRNGVRG